MRALLLVVLCGVVCSAQPPSAAADVTIASGKLHHHFLTNDLFRIDELWMHRSEPAPIVHMLFLYDAGTGSAGRPCLRRSC